MEKKITWTTQAGKVVTVTARLDLTKHVSLDGDECDLPCCEFAISADLDGCNMAYTEPEMLDKPREIGSLVVVAKMGKIGLTAERLAQVEALIAEVQAVPEWQAKIAAEKTACDAARKEQTEKRRHPGYCPKCESYCYGDCRSN